MPRGDGTGPLGNGPIGHGRNNCQGMNSGRRSSLFGSTGSSSTTQGSLEDQAARLEEEAAKLRKLAKQNNND